MDNYFVQSSSFQELAFHRPISAPKLPKPYQPLPTFRQTHSSHWLCFHNHRHYLGHHLLRKSPLCGLALQGCYIPMCISLLQDLEAKSRKYLRCNAGLMQQICTRRRILYWQPRQATCVSTKHHISTKKSCSCLNLFQNHSWPTIYNSQYTQNCI